MLSAYNAAGLTKHFKSLADLRTISRLIHAVKVFMRNGDISTVFWNKESINASNGRRLVH